MRKIIPVIQMLLPIGFVAAEAMLFAFRVESDVLFLATPYLYGFAALVISILYAVCNENKNLCVKLLGLPVDIGIAAYFVHYWLETMEAANNGAMGGGLGIALLIVILLPYLFFRIAGMVCCTLVCAGTAKKQKTLHTLLHLVPVGDLISAFLVHKQLRQ